jgi:hypothetical protein
MVMTMASDEEKRESTRRGYELLAQLDAMLPYQPAGEDVLEAVHNSMTQTWGIRTCEPTPEDHLFRYDIALRDAGGLEKHRAQVEARDRRFAKERAHEQRLAEQIRQRQMQADAGWNAWVERKIAAAREAEPFTELQVDVHGMAIAEERKRGRKELKAALDDLRSELTGTGHASGKTLALPAPLVHKIKDNSNAA